LALALNDAPERRMSERTLSYAPALNDGGVEIA
jgi:hypothetical protein